MHVCIGAAIVNYVLPIMHPIVLLSDCCWIVAGLLEDWCWIAIGCMMHHVSPNIPPRCYSKSIGAS